MLRKILKPLIVAIAVTVMIAGCATRTQQSGSGTYKVGSPYQIGGVWYYPKEDTFYDETGIASWYGADFHGKSTANGERYDMNTLTAAHRTLPLPTIVRVTNLDNGRSIRLRVNDRGPYARGRVIDVSSKAADLLGFKNRGTARVRVQFEGRGQVGASAPETDEEVGAPPEVRAAPLSPVISAAIEPPPGAAASPAPAVAPAIVPALPLAAAQAETVGELDGVVTTVQVPAVTQIWVQAGAFVSRGNADRLAATLSTVGHSQVSRYLQNGKAIFRVRFGPYGAVDDADLMLDKVIGAGQNGAQIIIE